MLKPCPNFCRKYKTSDPRQQQFSKSSACQRFSFWIIVVPCACRERRSYLSTVALQTINRSPVMVTAVMDQSNMLECIEVANTSSIVLERKIIRFHLLEKGTYCPCTCHADVSKEWNKLKLKYFHPILNYVLAAVQWWGSFLVCFNPWKEVLTPIEEDVAWSPETVCAFFVKQNLSLPFWEWNPAPFKSYHSYYID
jgi:hypothetical protein